KTATALSAAWILTTLSVWKILPNAPACLRRFCCANWLFPAWTVPAFSTAYRPATLRRWSLNAAVLLWLLRIAFGKWPVRFSIKKPQQKLISVFSKRCFAAHKKVFSGPECQRDRRDCNFFIGP